MSEDFEPLMAYLNSWISENSLHKETFFNLSGAEMMKFGKLRVNCDS